MCELRMFLRIVGARSAEQFDIIDIIEVKIPFDLNIIILDYLIMDFGYDIVSTMSKYPPTSTIYCKAVKGE